jgi:hypothetical protein
VWARAVPEGNATEFVEVCKRDENLVDGAFQLTGYDVAANRIWLPFAWIALRTRASIGSIRLTVAMKDWRIASRRFGSIAAANRRDQRSCNSSFSSSAAASRIGLHISSL